MFRFTAASQLNNNNINNMKRSARIWENRGNRVGEGGRSIKIIARARPPCDSDEGEALPECRALFFWNSELFEKERWQRRSAGIIVLLLRLKRPIHQAADGSGMWGWGWRGRKGLGEEMRLVGCFTQKKKRKKRSLLVILPSTEEAPSFSAALPVVIYYPLHTFTVYHQKMDPLY